ncbi:uncharacterized protein LOC113210422 isoform X2 [Frankliniella occidentalis]|nr:uncharacterized protein LOC113210422 isoform X2 [Frankliniella occidentalis]
MSSDGSTSISGVGDLARPAQRLIELLGVAHRCRDAVSANTCEYFTKYVHNGDACGFINSPLMPWASLMSKFEPPFKCPVQAGRYLLSNGTIDVDGIARMFGVSPNNDVWKFTVSIKDEKRAPFMCLDSAVRIVKYASRG